MSGAELGSAEFAYMLALVEAEGVVGVENGKLFPKKEAQREKTFGQGRAELEANGWLKPAVDHEDEYELDSMLFQLVAVIAAPQFVFSTSKASSSADQEQVLHYVADEVIVELSAPSAGRYHLGLVPDRGEMAERIGGMLGLTGSSPARFSLSGEMAARIKELAGAGNADDASEALMSADLAKPDQETLLEALAEEPKAHIVAARAQADEILQSVRASVFGQGEGAWIVYREHPEADQVEFATAHPESIETMLNAWLEELNRTAEVR